MSSPTAFLFDLDGTLVDSVYQHVLAWHRSLQRENIQLSVWRIHRKIGMSGGLFTNQLLRELGESVDAATIERLRAGHAEAYIELSAEVAPLPGAIDLLHTLESLDLPWAIATSGRMLTARPNLDALEVDHDKAVIVTRDQVHFAKPDPDLFIEAARRLGTTTQGSYVIGDSIWDMIAAARCGALGIGLLSGGYGRDELERSGALRVYDDPADMLRHLDEIAPRTRD
ncbi:MAG: family hydrolase [Alphaproteobacteria bacterium]|nr:family hydrolase [Alphaproteobacteria bacterium]MDB5720683.1 family hydrolase [Alphaproteobacteria bacterium]